MRPPIRLLSCMCAAAVFSYGQTAKAPSFEVASIKPPAPSARRIECSGGPGTADPGLWRCSNVPLAFLISRAYGFEAYQFAPSNACCRASFDFLAKVPAGTSQAQFRVMLQKLLEERFRFAFHYQSKAMTTYELTVDERGLKMKPSPAEAAPERDPWELPVYTIGKDGYPEFPNGRGGLAGLNGRYRWMGYGVSMQEIAKTLSFHLGGPVVDATGLTGMYDFDLRWGIDLAWLLERSGHREDAAALPDSGPPGPPLLRAVRDQLGLKLTAKKGAGDVVVIDHLEKVPTVN